MSSDLAKSLRRLKPEKHLTPFRRRAESELTFVSAGVSDGEPRPRRLVLDTTVYIDDLQGKLPEEVGDLMGSADLWHTSVSIAELSFSLGRLDPGHPSTPRAVAQISAAIQKIPDRKILTPSTRIWREAAITCGMLNRVQGTSDLERRRLLNDCLIFFTAMNAGCCVLTRNLRDFDCLMQAMPGGRAVFYRDG